MIPFNSKLHLPAMFYRISLKAKSIKFSCRNLLESCLHTVQITETYEHIFFNLDIDVSQNFDIYIRQRVWK